MIKGKTSNELEHCLKGLVPIIRVAENRFLFGTTVKTVQLKSEKIMVQVGGGSISLAEHWRAIAVTETIKLNKLIAQSNSKKMTCSKAVRHLLERNYASQEVVEDFMVEADTLDALFRSQSFLLKAWSKRQLVEQKARNSPARGTKKKSVTGSSVLSSSASSKLATNLFQKNNGSAASMSATYPGKAKNNASPGMKAKKIYGSGGGTHTPNRKY